MTAPTITITLTLDQANAYAGYAVMGLLIGQPPIEEITRTLAVEAGDIVEVALAAAEGRPVCLPFAAAVEEDKP